MKIERIRLRDRERRVVGSGGIRIRGVEVRRREERVLEARTVFRRMMRRRGVGGRDHSLGIGRIERLVVEVRTLRRRS